MVLFLLVWSRSFPTAPTLRTTHPATLSMVQKKNKAWVLLWQCACGRFILYTHSFRYFPFHSIPLRYFVSFISPTSAPHSKSNPFFTFHKAYSQAFRVMAYRYARHNAYTHRYCTSPCNPPNAFVPFHSVIAFAFFHPHHRKRYALFFSAKCLPQLTHERQYSSNWNFIES